MLSYMYIHPNSLNIVNEFKSMCKQKLQKDNPNECRVSLVELPPFKLRFNRRQSPAALISDVRT